jgi:hypothetical protein
VWRVVDPVKSAGLLGTSPAHKKKLLLAIQMEYALVDTADEHPCDGNSVFEAFLTPRDCNGDDAIAQSKLLSNSDVFSSLSVRSSPDCGACLHARVQPSAILFPLFSLLHGNS